MYASDLKHPDLTLENKLHRLYALNRNKAIDLSFRPPYLKLLEKFGNPHLSLPPVIHVAGTNGKGSIIAMLRSILEEAGYSVHAYTSPHLIRFNERIVLNGKPIEDAPLEALIDETLLHNDGQDITFFEITTAMAFAAFSRTPADICLLEVGLGGRLDCTNIIDKPAASVISAVGKDHMEYLGQTIKDIAAEKAGIIKAECPCIAGLQNYDEAYPVFEEIAHAKNAAFHKVSPLENTYEQILLGRHQRNNCAAALKTLEVIQSVFPVNDTHIKEGLKKTRWSARLQPIDTIELDLTDEWQIFLDGGHNPDAAIALSAQIKDWGSDQPVHLICGMMKGKDSDGFLAPLTPLCESISFVDIPNEPLAQKAADLQALCQQGQIYDSYRDALTDIKDNLKPGRILICGSLYLAGHVLKDLGKSAHT